MDKHHLLSTVKRKTLLGSRVWAHEGGIGHCGARPGSLCTSCEAEKSIREGDGFDPDSQPLFDHRLLSSDQPCGPSRSHRSPWNHEKSEALWTSETRPEALECYCVMGQNYMPYLSGVPGVPVTRGFTFEPRATVRHAESRAN